MDPENGKAHTQNKFRVEHEDNFKIQYSCKKIVRE